LVVLQQNEVLKQIAITTQPKLTYKVGEALDLALLKVKATYSGGTEDPDYKNYTANPANGTVIVMATHNGNPVRITSTDDPSLVLTTNNLTVSSNQVAVPLVDLRTGVTSDASDSTGRTFIVTDAVTNLFFETIPADTTVRYTRTTNNSNPAQPTSANSLLYSNTVGIGLAFDGTNPIKIGVLASKDGFQDSTFTVYTIRNENSGKINYTVAAYPASGATTALTFTFGSSIAGITNTLTAAMIELTDGTGSATKGALTGSGTTWTLAVSAVSPGTITVAIVNDDITAGEKTVTVQ